MGLLLGDVLYAEDGTATARIWVAMPQIRTDRRKVSFRKTGACSLSSVLTSCGRHT